MTGSFAEYNVFRKVESFTPIDDLSVRIMRVFGAERRPANETFEHDGSDRPPVAGEGVSFAGKDFRCNVVGGSDSRVSHDAT